MPRHLRFQQGDWSTHHVVSRCLQGFSFLIPHAHIVEICAGVLSYALERYQDHITIQHYAFLSNHFHMLISSKDRFDLSAFMNLFKSKLTRELNRVYDWKGSIWEGRYGSEEILDEESFIEVFKYITKNSVKEGLVEHPRDWLGLHGYHQIVEGRPLRGAYVHRSKMHQSATLTEADVTTQHEATLTPPPMWESEGLAAYYERGAALCEEAIKEARQALKGRALGMKRVLQMSVFQSRRAPTRARPQCRARCLDALRAFREGYARFKAAFQEISGEMRAAVRFGLPLPPRVFPPGGVPLFGGQGRTSSDLFTPSSSSTRSSTRAVVLSPLPPFLFWHFISHINARCFSSLLTKTKG
jgi:putative transposase